MKKYFVLILFMALISINATAQILINYKCSGKTVTKSSDDVQFTINWTVTYEASWKLIFSDDQKIAVQKRIRNSVNNRLILLFTKNTAEDLIVARRNGIQAAVDNPNFIDALTGEFLNAFVELFDGDTEKVPDFNILKLNLDGVFAPQEILDKYLR
jgi:hypothetical protein